MTLPDLDVEEAVTTLMQESLFGSTEEVDDILWRLITALMLLRSKQPVCLIMKARLVTVI